MRRPTPDAFLLQWWANAVISGDDERHEDQPKCGYYKRKLVKNGPWVPVRIVCQRDVDENGFLASDEVMIAQSHDGVDFEATPIWPYCVPITVREYMNRMKNLPDATHAAVDLLTIPATPGDTDA